MSAELVGDDRMLWLTERDVGELLTINEAIDVLELVLPAEMRGTATSLTKTVATWEPASSQHAIGAFSTESGIAAFKTWVNTPRGATAVVTLFDIHNGALLAVIEAVTLGALRTAAIAGLATRWLAHPEADELALLGTGRQALHQLAAINAVRRLRRVRIYSATSQHRSDFRTRAALLFPFEVVDAPSVAAAVEGAPIVTAITRAREPIVDLALLSEGVHVNAMGAVLPGSAELQPEVVRAATLLVVDNKENARVVSRELQNYCGENEARWANLQTLGEVIAEDVVRPPSPRLTLLKSVGMGLSDLAVASLVFRRATENDVGHPIARSRIQPPSR